MSISVQALTKMYGDQKAVNDISFTISSGNIVGFLGPNGAGKSTTMKILTTYITPSAGKAEVVGLDVVKQAKDVRRNIGYLPEGNPLYYDMYVKEYLLFAAEIHQLGNKTRSRVDEMIDITGLTKEVRKKIGTLSKGYKQRVGIAQAMLHDPQVLILDEPTSGLDPNQIIEIRNLITNLGKEKTVLLSTHIMQEVEAMCNRVIIINNGQLIADGSIHQLQSYSSSKHNLLVTFGQKITLDMLNELNNIAHIKMVSSSEFCFSTSVAPEQLRKKILAWAVNSNMDIISMRQEEQKSLENIFRELTL